MKNIKKYFPNALSFQPICSDPDGVFSFYRVFVPDDEDPEFEQEFLVITDEEGRVIFSAAVLHGSEGIEIFPDFKKTFYMDKLKELVQEIEEKLSSRSKFEEKKEIIFDPDFVLYLDVHQDTYRLRYYESGAGEKGSQILLQTTNQEIGYSLEELLEIRARVFCEC